MIGRMLAVIGAAMALALPAPGRAQPADLPAAGAETYAPFARLIGKTWRGAGTGAEAVEDIQRWDWAVGGHAVRVTHSVNAGAYGGETLIFRDKDTGDFIFHYFTSGGFHTTGVIETRAPGVFEIAETVHGVDGLEALRSTGVLGEDGVYRVRARMERDGAWVETGGFDYREDASAVVVMPVRAAAQVGPVEAPASAGPLNLSRRIVVGTDGPGEAVAGYLRIRNGSPVADQLVSASCACADAIEFHMIRRGPDGASMSAEPGLDIPGQGTLDIRPGSDLHLMLLGYDPSKAVDGKVTVSLTFRDAGEATADFVLVGNSRVAWDAFD